MAMTAWMLSLCVLSCVITISNCDSPIRTKANITSSVLGDRGIAENSYHPGDTDHLSKQAVSRRRYLRPDYMDGHKLDRLLELHNAVRSAVSPTADQMLKMSWDYDLEATAWEKTQKCTFSSRKSKQSATGNKKTVGENLWVAWGIPIDIVDPEAVITSWMKGRKYFEPSLKACIGGSCERYTQLVWATTYKMGCAYSECKSISVHGFDVQDAILLACHYSPGGNTGELIPYYHGLSCSFCGAEDYCRYKLCTNVFRDRTTGTKPFPDETSTIANEATTPLSVSEKTKIAIIVIASLAGFVIFAMVVFHITDCLAKRRASPNTLDRRQGMKRTPRRFNNDKATHNSKFKPSAGRRPSMTRVLYEANFLKGN